MSRTIAFLLNARGTRGELAPGAGVGAPAAALAALLPFAFFAGLVAAWGAGVAAWGAGAASSFWIAAQMRVVAFARFSNFFTGFRSSKPGVPAKLFQVSTRRLTPAHSNAKRPPHPTRCTSQNQIGRAHV